LPELRSRGTSRERGAFDREQTPTPTASREAVSAKQSGPSVPGPGVAFTPLDWSTDAGMEIPGPSRPPFARATEGGGKPCPRAHPPLPKNWVGVGGTPGKNFWMVNRARPLRFARKFGTPTMRGSRSSHVPQRPVSDGRPEKGARDAPADVSAAMRAILSSGANARRSAARSPVCRRQGVIGDWARESRYGEARGPAAW
jgi:hypothetical protein